MRMLRNNNEHPTAIVTLSDKVLSFPDIAAILGGSVDCSVGGTKVLGGQVGGGHLVVVGGTVVGVVVVGAGVVVLGVVVVGGGVAEGKGEGGNITSMSSSLVPSDSNVDELS